MYTSHIPRKLIIGAQILGTFLSLLVLVAMIYGLLNVQKGINDENSVDNTRALSMVLLWSGWMTLIAYFTWKTLFTCIVIIRFLNKSDDLQVSNNRYILSALSLNLGGIFTPFILTRLPNIDVQSSINPRWFLSRVMGMTTLVGGIIAFLTFFISLLSFNGVAAKNGTIMFQNFDLFNLELGITIIMPIIITISSILIAFGGLTTALFFQNKNSQEAYLTDQGGYNKVLKVISWIWGIIITLELVLVIFISLLRLVYSIVDTIAQGKTDNKAAVIFLGIIGLLVGLLNTYWIVSTTIKTMIGIWKKSGISYNQFDKLNEWDPKHLGKKEESQSNYY